MRVEQKTYVNLYIIVQTTKKNTLPILGRVLNLNLIYLFLFASAIFIARTFKGNPKRLMNPSASWWSYNSPVVKLAKDSLYNEYGDVVPALMILPL